LFAAFGALNVLVALSTMTTGWHYFADLVAGLALGGASFWLVQACSPWIYAEWNTNKWFKPN
jgi:membrane-associated phospholipid phosphatase